MDVHHKVQPKKDDCLKILKQFKVPDEIVRHSIKVNQVAMLLGQKLVERQELIDLQVLDRASLLHDLMKHTAGSEGHCAKGAEVLLKLGYPEIAHAINNHRLDFILTKKFNNWEELLVYYADKRVDGELIVSIDERIDSLKVRHSEYAESIENTREPLRKLEEQVFKHLKFRPEQLAEKIRNFTGAQMQSGCL